MSKTDQFTVDSTGRRLDRFLAAQYPEHSRSYLQRLIAQGEVVVNGDAVTRKSTSLHQGDAVQIHFPPPTTLTLAAEDIPLPVLHEDDAILVIDKPADMVVHPGAGTHSGTLVNALLGYDGEQFQQMVDDDMRPGIVHRLDKDTTGVLVVARTQVAKGRLGQAFAERRVHKVYLALAEGRLPQAEVEVKRRIGRHPVRRKEMTVTDHGGKSASTTFRELGHAEGLSLIEARPHTGRTHQIRVHLKSLQCGIVGDAVYGRRRPRYQAPRQMLHAWRLALPHPDTGETVTFTAPIPADMTACIEAAGLTPPEPQERWPRALAGDR